MNIVVVKHEASWITAIKPTFDLRADALAGYIETIVDIN